MMSRQSRRLVDDDDDESPHTLAHDARADKNDKDDVAIVFKNTISSSSSSLCVSVLCLWKKQVSLSFLANAQQSLQRCATTRDPSCESLSLITSTFWSFAFSLSKKL